MKINSLTRSNHDNSGHNQKMVAAAAAPNTNHNPVRRRLVTMGAALTLAGATFLSVAPTMAGASDAPVSSVEVEVQQPQVELDKPWADDLTHLQPSDTGGDTSGSTSGDSSGGAGADGPGDLVATGSGGDSGSTSGGTSGGTDGQNPGDLIPTSSGGDTGGTDGKPECDQDPKKLIEKCPPPKEPECKDDPETKVDECNPDEKPDCDDKKVKKLAEDCPPPKEPECPEDDEKPESKKPGKLGKLKDLDRGDIQLAELPPEKIGVPSEKLPEIIERPKTPEDTEPCDKPETPEVPETPETPEYPVPTTPDVKVNVQVDQPVLANPNFTG